MKKSNIKTGVIAFVVTAASMVQVAQAQWSLTGNAGTVPGTNFVGTTDAKSLYFKTNGSTKMVITSGGKVGIGSTAPTAKFQVEGSKAAFEVFRFSNDKDATKDSIMFMNPDGKVVIGGTYAYPGTNLTVMGGDANFNTVQVGLGGGSQWSNVVVGATSFYSNTLGAENCAFGTNTLGTNSTGNANTACGFYALYNSNGSVNTAVGKYALLDNTTGGGNVALGVDAGIHNTTGNYNTACGISALVDNTTGSNNSGLGNNAKTSVGNLTLATAIGALATVNASNKVRLGDASITVVEGQVGYSFPSDARFKENIKNDVKGLDFILALQPVSYNFNRLKFAKHVKQHLNPEMEELLVAESQKRSVGFLAQDVEKSIQQTGFTAFDALHTPTNETDNYSLGYAEFTVPLVKAVQELSKQNTELKNAIAEMKAQYESLSQDAASKISSSAIFAQDGKLFQNQPNPFNQSTIIRYQLSGDAKSGVIVIRDLSGNLVKSIAVNNTDKGQVTVNANELATGTYTYTLEVAGLSTDTKLMVVTK